jgi:hypothetical protein
MIERITNSAKFVNNIHMVERSKNIWQQIVKN